MKRIKKLNQNLTGRDFVVGDVHGCFSQLRAAMQEVKFDPLKDRLILLGDIIDRGPECGEAETFLAQPFVHAVCGNHDVLFADMFSNGDPEHVVLETLSSSNYNGMGWMFDCTMDHLRSLASVIRQLPVAIEVATQMGAMGFVHADVPTSMSWNSFLELIEAGDEHALFFALESRERMKAMDNTPVPGISRVFVGHTVQRDGPTQLGNIFAIDTGAVIRHLKPSFPGSLTIAEIDAPDEAFLQRGRYPINPVLNRAS